MMERKKALFEKPAKKQKKILQEYDKIAKIIWSKYSKYHIVEGSYNKVSLKKLNLKSTLLI